jgi:hypothetical protein
LMRRRQLARPNLMIEEGASPACLPLQLAERVARTNPTGK